MSEKTKLLQYTGADAKTFPELGAELQPGDPFTVSADEAERYLRRGDIEDAMPKPGRKPKGTEGASDNASASQDGDTNGESPSGGDDSSGSPTGNGGTGEQ